MNKYHKGRKLGRVVNALKRRVIYSVTDIF